MNVKILAESAAMKTLYHHWSTVYYFCKSVFHCCNTLIYFLFCIHQQRPSTVWININVFSWTEDHAFCPSPTHCLQSSELLQVLQSICTMLQFSHHRRRWQHKWTFPKFNDGKMALLTFLFVFAYTKKKISYMLTSYT